MDESAGLSNRLMNFVDTRSLSQVTCWKIFLAKSSHLSSSSQKVRIFFCKLRFKFRFWRLKASPWTSNLNYATWWFPENCATSIVWLRNCAETRVVYYFGLDEVRTVLLNRKWLWWRWLPGLSTVFHWSERCRKMSRSVVPLGWFWFYWSLMIFFYYSPGGVYWSTRTRLKCCSES